MVCRTSVLIPLPADYKNNASTMLKDSTVEATKLCNEVCSGSSDAACNTLEDGFLSVPLLYLSIYIHVAFLGVTGEITQALHSA